MKSKNVSIIIPVYNEQEYIGACLDAIGRQNLKPLEVLLIDNNSTDKTVQIGSKFSFVKIIKEENQGVVYARDRGFNEARGKILARIDGDSIIDPDWVAHLEQIFKNKEIDAVTGSNYYYDVMYPKAGYWTDLFFRKDLAKSMEDKNQAFLQGNNMAISKELWNKIKHKTCSLKGIHEDIDLAIHAMDLNANILFDQDLRVGVSARRLQNGFISFYKYLKIAPLTYKYHKKKYGYKFYPFIFALLVSYYYILFNHLIYDPKTKRADLKRLKKYHQTKKRVDPTRFVDQKR
jgi:glycosyltransferase involved in cell wall biosynthesis